jgi:O-antigen/teichoic acid export membrane protein
MTFRKKIFKGTMVLGTSHVLSKGFAFIRNVIIARLISPEDFGVAATFVITITLFELMSNLGLQLLIVQDPNGKSKRFQSVCQLMQVIRGFIAALIIYLIASPISSIFNIPDALWAFQLLAIIPLIHGLNHLDIFRFQRDMQYMPTATVEVVSEFVTLLAAWPLGMYFRDYSALLWLLIAKSIIYAGVSHLVANRSYGWSIDMQILKKIFSFGWPLLINGLLLFGIQQGDRLIIGSGYDMTSLGLYSVAFTLTATAAMVFANINRSIMLPIFSAAQNDISLFTKRYKYSIQVLCFISTFTLLVFILYGNWLIDFIYGSAYSKASAFIGWLAAMQAIRLIRVAPTQAAIAQKDTKNAMLANITRLVSLPIALLIALTGQSLVWIPFVGFVGELLAYIISILRLRYKQNLEVKYSLKPIIIFGPIVVTTALSIFLGVMSTNFFAITLLAVVLVLIMIIIGLFTFDDQKSLHEKYFIGYNHIISVIKNIKSY